MRHVMLVYSNCYTTYFSNFTSDKPLARITFMFMFMFMFMGMGIRMYISSRGTGLHNMFRNNKWNDHAPQNASCFAIKLSNVHDKHEVFVVVLLRLL